MPCSAANKDRANGDTQETSPSRTATPTFIYSIICAQVPRTDNDPPARRGSPRLQVLQSELLQGRFVVSPTARSKVSTDFKFPRGARGK